MLGESKELVVAVLHVGWLVVDVVLDMDVQTALLVGLAFDAVHFEALANHGGVEGLGLHNVVVVRSSGLRDGLVLLEGAVRAFVLGSHG